MSNTLTHHKKNNTDTIIHNLIHGSHYISSQGQILYTYYAFDDEENDPAISIDNPYACYIGDTDIPKLSQFLKETAANDTDITDAVNTATNILRLYQELTYNDPQDLQILKTFINVHKPWFIASNEVIDILATQYQKQSTVPNYPYPKFENVCPVCAEQVNVSPAYKEQGSQIQRQLICPECGTIWSEKFVPANRCIITFGKPQEKEPTTVSEAVNEMLDWAYNTAFVRGDEYPHIECDEILSTINMFAKKILAADSKEN